MRLPWPFGRAQRSANADGGATPGGPSESPPERASGDAWRQLPPLAETVGPPPLVAPNRPFAAALAANEPPAPILAPLSHGRSLEAPRGLVSGIARPTATASGPSLPVPVQRSPLGTRRAGAGTDSTGESWSAADPDAQADNVAPSPVPEPAVAPERPSVPIRRLEAVPDAAPKRAALTRAPDPSRPATPAGLVGQPRVPGAASQPGLGAPGNVQRSPATPEPAAPQVPPTPVPAPAVPQAPLPASPRLTIGQARRLGLGAPVAGGPVGTSTPVFTGGSGAAIQRGAPPASAAATSPATAGGIQRSPEPGAPGLPLAGHVASVTSRSEESESERGPAPELERPATPARLPEPSPRAHAVIARPIIDLAEGRTPSTGSARIVSSAPLRTRVQRAPLTIPQRAPDEAAAGGASPTSTPARAAAAGAPVKIHRDSEASQLSSALDARSFTHGGEIFLPASHGPLTSGRGKALLAHEMTHVAQQRRLGSSLPQEHTSHGQSLEAEAVAAERAPEMPLAQTQKEAPVAAPSPMAATTFPGGQAAGDGHAHGPAMTAGVQRAPVRERPGEARRQRPEDKPEPTDRELEDLAQKLYARIGRQLRRELLVDRERAGMAVDLVR